MVTTIWCRLDFPRGKGLGFFTVRPFCCLREISLVFLLTVAIPFGLLCLQLKFGLVFFAYGRKLVWAFYLRLPPVRRLGLVSFSETGRIWFRGVRFQTPSSVSFFGRTEFGGASSVISF